MAVWYRAESLEEHRRIGKAAWRSSTAPQVPAGARTESCVRACRRQVNTRMDRRARTRLPGATEESATKNRSKHMLTVPQREISESRSSPHRNAGSARG